MPDTTRSTGIVAQEVNDSVVRGLQDSVSSLCLHLTGVPQRKSIVVIAFTRTTNISLDNPAVDPVMALLSKWKKKNLFPKAPQGILTYENEISMLGLEGAKTHLLPLNQSRFAVRNTYLKTVKAILNRVTALRAK